MEYINYWLRKMIKDTPNDMKLGEKIREMSWKQIKKEIVQNENHKYIYERNPDTGEIFKRKFGDYNSPRECVNPEINSVPNIKTENMKKISLYDYLGHAAGPELGQQVATAARAAGVKGEMREVSNPKYRGPVMLWPRALLDLYFKGGLNEGTTGKQLLKG